MCLKSLLRSHTTSVPKIVVVLSLHTYYVYTKFERNLRRVSLFHVDPSSFAHSVE